MVIKINMRKLAIIAGLIVCIQGIAQDLSKEVEVEINKRVENRINQSIAIGIIDADGYQFYSFGTNSNGGAKVDEHTIYEIGSISKVFTASLLVIAVSNKNLSIDDPIQWYLPDGVLIPKYDGKEITFGHLSDHTSSLPRLPGNMNPKDPTNPYADYSVEQMYSFLTSHELRREIGSQYEYSNLAVGLLGHILALNANMSYEELLSGITKSLKMKATKITMDDKMKANLAIGHDNGSPVNNWDLPTLAGAGAIRSSVHDMVRFIDANLNSESYPVFQTTHTVRHSKAGGTRVGLGWHISKGSNGDVIWHNGGTGGYKTFAGFVKETNQGVVVLSNSTESVDDIGMKLLNPAANLRIMKAPITSLLQQAIDSEGVDAALALYTRLKSEEQDKYDFSEESINILGYSFLKNNLPAALALFKININEHPKSFNAYDSYGEALKLDGQNEKAIENYKKSVELNPGNSNGIKALQELGVDFAPMVEVSAEILQSYVGKYQLTPQFFIEVTSENDKIYIQATGQPRFEIFAKNETEFYLKVVNAQIVFKVNDEQKVESLTLFQGGQVLPGKKVE